MRIKTSGILLSAATIAIAISSVEPPSRAADAPSGGLHMSLGAGLVTTPQLIKGVLSRRQPASISGGMGRAFGYERYRAAKTSGRLQSMGEVFGDAPIFDAQHNRYSSKARFVPTRSYFDASGTLIS